MGINSYEELLKHVGHKVVVVCYGLPTKSDKRTLRKSIRRTKDEPANVSVECETCHEVLLDFDKPEPPEKAK